MSANFLKLVKQTDGKVRVVSISEDALTEYGAKTYPASYDVAKNFNVSDTIDIVTHEGKDIESIELTQVKVIETPFKTFAAADFDTYDELFAILKDYLFTEQSVVGVDSVTQSTEFATGRTGSIDTSDYPWDLSNVTSTTQTTIPILTGDNIIIISAAADDGSEVYYEKVNADFTITSGTVVLNNATPPSIGEGIGLNDFKFVTNAKQNDVISAEYQTDGSTIAKIGKLEVALGVFEGRRTFQNTMRFVPAGEVWTLHQIFATVINNTDTKGVDVSLAIRNPGDDFFSYRTPVGVKIPDFQYPYVVDPVVLPAGTVIKMVVEESYTVGNKVIGGLEFERKKS